MGDLACNPQMNTAMTAGRIRSLALAAEVVRYGNGLYDEAQIEAIVLDILDVIVELAGMVERTGA